MTDSSKPGWDLPGEHIARRLAAIQKKLLRADELASDANDMLAELREDIECRTVTRLTETPAPTDSEAALAREILEQRAQAGVDKIKLEWNYDDSATVTIPTYPSMNLSHSLGLLLQILSADWGIRTDALVGWKSSDELIQAIEKRTGKDYSRSALTSAIRRLRKKFCASGNNYMLIQTHPAYGYRFARKACP